MDDVVVRALQERRVDRDDGRSPRVASPAAKVTACPSAMPTSKNRSGWARATASVPVPLGIAAVIVTTFSFSEPSSASPFPNTAVYAAFVAGLELLPGCRIMAGRKRVPFLDVLARREPLCPLRETRNEAPSGTHGSPREGVHQRVDVVAVDRAEVAKAELLEQHAGREKLFIALLRTHDRAGQRARRALEPLAGAAERTRL